MQIYIKVSSNVVYHHGYVVRYQRALSFRPSLRSAKIYADAGNGLSAALRSPVAVHTLPLRRKLDGLWMLTGHVLRPC